MLVDASYTVQGIFARVARSCQLNPEVYRREGAGNEVRAKGRGLGNACVAPGKVPLPGLSLPVQSIAVVNSSSRNARYCMLNLIMRRFFYLCRFLVFLGLLFTKTGHADIVSVLESPAADQKVSGVSAVSGWAFSSDPNAHLTIQFSVDGGTSTHIPCCTERLDVARDHADFPQALGSGFALLYNFNILSEGPHKVVVTIQDGLSSPQVQEHAIVVAKPGGFEFLNSLSLASASKTELSSDKQEIL